MDIGKKKLAFAVTVFDHSRVFFAEDTDDAAEQCKQEDCGCEECPKGKCDNFSFEVNREPALDKYAGAPNIPIEAYYEAGWGWVCQECGFDYSCMPGDWRPVNGEGLCHDHADIAEDYLGITAEKNDGAQTGTTGA